MDLIIYMVLRLPDIPITIIHLSRDGNTKRLRFRLTNSFLSVIGCSDGVCLQILFAQGGQTKTFCTYLAVAYHGPVEVVKILLDAARPCLPHYLAKDYAYNLVISSFQAFVTQPTVKMNTSLHLVAINDHVAARLLQRRIQAINIFKTVETPIYLAARLIYLKICAYMSYVVK